MSENEAKKLTKEQRHEKIRRKFERDIKKECRACLFKIEDLSDKRIKFKLDKNAQQLYLTGICIYANKAHTNGLPSLLLVEGGPLAIKKYKTLMLRRIKWFEKKVQISLKRKIQLIKMKKMKCWMEKKMNLKIIVNVVWFGRSLSLTIGCIKEKIL